jgi:hypothetical protein
MMSYPVPANPALTNPPQANPAVVAGQPTEEKESKLWGKSSKGSIYNSKS